MGVFAQTWGHPAHTAWALLTQHFYPSDELNPRAKQIKNFHSFNYFIQQKYNTTKYKLFPKN